MHVSYSTCSVVSSVLCILQSPCLKSPLWIYCWRGKRWSMGRFRKARGCFIFIGSICSSPSNEGCRNWLLRATTWLDVWVCCKILWCLPLVPAWKSSLYSGAEILRNLSCKFCVFFLLLGTTFHGRKNTLNHSYLWKTQTNNNSAIDYFFRQ